MHKYCTPDHESFKEAFETNLSSLENLNNLDFIICIIFQNILISLLQLSHVQYN